MEVRLDRGCCRWHGAQQRGHHHLECSLDTPSPPTKRVSSTPGPSKVHRAPPLLGSSARWATARTQTLRAHEGAGRFVSMPASSFFIE